MLKDDELYEKFLRGDTASYDELMIRHGDDLLLYLYGYLRNWHDAEDLMIEAFARVMVKRPAIREGNFKAYLFRTGRNLASRFHSISKRMEMFDLKNLEEEISGGKLPPELVWNQEKSQILYLCLDRIDPKLREALWLVYYEGMKYAQAAEVMGMSVKKLDKLLARGKAHMREELIKEGVNDAY